MRLLNTSSYQMHSFLGAIPPYAILSHTWGEEEVTYELISDAELRQGAKGWAKMKQSCARARGDGWSWIWIDTCCINKADTTELGEAINSMFRWYEAADICYAYLVDVPPRYELSDEETRPGYLHPPDENGIPWKWCFRSSRWFKRGWTLQELLAPRCLLFLDARWTDIGARENMASEVQIAAGISLHHLADFRSSSIAAKMSWAADRQTTREEDRAYSLLGLFGVSLPLIYGEGSRAFLRLQKELIQDQNDESILASVSPGILARSPADFREAGNLVPWRNDPLRKTFSTTNIGVSLNAELLHHTSRRDPDGVHAIQLNCREQYPGLESTALPIFVQLEAKDDALEIFTKPFWSTFGHRDSVFHPSEFTSLGRKDIFITYQSKTEFEAVVEAHITINLTRWIKNTLWTTCSIEVFYFWDSATRNALRNWEDERSDLTRRHPIHGLRELKRGTAECYEIKFTHSNVCRERLWLVIDTTSWPPRLGVWTATPGFGKLPLLRTVSTLPNYLWPNTAELACRRQKIEVSITAACIWRDDQVRRYNLDFRVVMPSMYTGAIGRHLHWTEALAQRRATERDYDESKTNRK